MLKIIGGGLGDDALLIALLIVSTIYEDANEYLVVVELIV
jgi:hypothetical protein